MSVVPVKQIIRHRKIFVAGCMAAFLCTVFYLRRVPTIEQDALMDMHYRWESQNQNKTRLHDSIRQFETKAGFNWLINLNTTYKSSNQHTRKKYVVNMEETSLRGAEDDIFGNDAEKMRVLTRRVDDVLLKSAHAQARGWYLGVYPRPDMQGAEKLGEVLRDSLSSGYNRLGVALGTHVYFPGGHWIPMTRTAKWKVAIVIPFRDRFANLYILLRNLIPFLQSQELEFGIFVAEQGYSEVMNRGLMRNIGYHLARNSGTVWDCYVFHDVDYVPVNTTNYYGCDEFPKHFASKLEEFNYSNPFLEDFGGVVGITGTQIERINGYSNMYWGWGGEDDDLLRRINAFQYNISRPNDGFYRNLHHNKSSGKEMCKERFCLLRYARKRMQQDGLSTLQYPGRTSLSLSTLYVNISVDVSKAEWNHGYRYCFRSHRIVHEIISVFLVILAAIFCVVMMFIALVHTYCERLL